MKHTLLCAALLSLAACNPFASESDPPPSPAEAPAPEPVEPEPEDDALRAARIAREIRAAPDDAEAVLERHGMTIDEFEELIYEISADPAASERYRDALGPE